MENKIQIDKNIFILMLGMIRTIDKKYAENLADYYMKENDIYFEK